MNALQILSTLDAPAVTAGLILTGRDDTALEAYAPLAEALQAEWEKEGDALNIYITNDLTDADSMISELKALNCTTMLVGGHSMQDGGLEAQNYAKANAENLDGLLLLSSFLERTHRPTVEACLAKKQDIDYDSEFPPNADELEIPNPLGCRLGCMVDGVHDCYGDNSIDYPLPTLTVAGGLDGVTRVTRMAEAWYTQVTLTEGGATQHPVIVVNGMNHQNLLEGAPAGQVSAMDLESESSALNDRATVAAAFRSFFGPAKKVDAALTAQTAEFFAPIVEAFVDMEGSWWFTGADEEHGPARFENADPNMSDVACGWSAIAHEMMMSPLPEGVTWTDDAHDEFRLVSDAPFVPPYRREEHRPVLDCGNGDGGNCEEDAKDMFFSRTVTQLRYIPVSLRESQVGLNADAILRDEKISLLTELADDGLDYLSAIELTSKFNSRQLVYRMFGEPAPESLDEGSRCKTINEAAYAWALKTVSPEALARYEAKGTKYVFVEDNVPRIEAGPFFIWKYLEYEPKPLRNVVEVAAMTAFFPLSAGDYGAGNHYCKLISPARVVEWIMVDSLRA